MLPWLLGTQRPPLAVHLIGGTSFMHHASLVHGGCTARRCRHRRAREKFIQLRTRHSEIGDPGLAGVGCGIGFTGPVR